MGVLKNKFLTILRGKTKISRSHEMGTLGIREMEGTECQKTSSKSALGRSAAGRPATDSLKCPYCFSTNFVKRGLRQKKHEKVQLYLCKACGKTFTAQITKGKHYPLSIIFDAVSLYNLGHSLEKTCELVNTKSVLGQNVKDKSNFGIGTSTLSNWLKETEELCKFKRMREFAIKKYSPADMVITATLAHQQLFRYRFHRAKCELMIQEEFQHRKFTPLKEFLEMVPVECPHQYFSARGGQATGLRASEAPMTFSKKQMIVRAKQNYATRLCEFVLQSVKERKQRHNALQKFMLYNDSVTVATEVPVYLTKDDLLHMQTQLGFEMFPKRPAAGVARPSGKQETSPKKTTSARDRASEDRINIGTGTIGTGTAEIVLPKLITGHIDILQIRNGQIHLLDYKPKAEKGQPIEQLTLYAMALSRLTGLRLFEFKCAWFDENDYFEFYPLHVLHKPRKGRRRRKVYTMEGIYEINKDDRKIEKIRPL